MLVSSKELLGTVASAASDALAQDMVAIDVTDTLPFSDAFLIATADNPRHLRSLISAVAKEVRDGHGRAPVNVEGDQGAEWVLMDYGDVVVHFFLPEARGFYALDKLWSRSPRVALDMLAEE